MKSYKFEMLIRDMSVGAAGGVLCRRGIKMDLTTEAEADLPNEQALRRETAAVLMMGVLRSAPEAVADMMAELFFHGNDLPAVHKLKEELLRRAEPYMDDPTKARSLKE